MVAADRVKAHRRLYDFFSEFKRSFITISVTAPSLRSHAMTLPLILIGTMNLTRTRQRGDFYCPGCRQLRGYRRRARRPFLTVYLIPLIPIGGVEEFVQCDDCRANWDPAVLEADRRAHEAADMQRFRDEALRAAVLTVIADGRITENEIEALQRIGGHLLERPVEREELGQLCSAAYQNRITAANYITSVAPRWTPEQRILGVQAVFLAASADGELSPKQMQLLSALQRQMEMTDQQFQAVIEDSVYWG